MVVQQPPSLNERKLLAEWYLTRGNESDSRKTALKTMELITEVEYRTMVVEVTSHEREVKKYIKFYGPVPDPFPHPEFRMGTPEQWAEEDQSGEQDHDFFAKHAIKPMASKTAAQFKMAGGMQVARNFEQPFQNVMKEKTTPFRLLPAWQKPRDVTPST